MKLLIIFFITIFYYTQAYSAPPDSLTTDQKNSVIEEAKKVEEKKGEDFGNRRGKDAFIDKDGDGICDQRVKGMSFEKAQRRHMQRNRGGKSGTGTVGGNGNQNGNK